MSIAAHDDEVGAGRMGLAQQSFGRVGRAGGIVTVRGSGNEMRPADVVKLLPRLRTRLGAES